MRAAVASVWFLLAGVAAHAGAAESERGFSVVAGAAFASTDGRAGGREGTTGIPFVAPVGGLPFEDDDVAWRALLDWSPDGRWSLHVGYVDLGTFSSVPVFFGLPAFGGVGGPSYVAEVEARAWTLGGSFRAPFGDGPWYGAVEAGVSRASFDVETRYPGALAALPSATPSPLNPSVIGNPGSAPPFTVAAVPAFGGLDDETGWQWGVAVGRRIGERWRAEIAYRQYDVEVLEIQWVGLDVRWTF